MNVKEKKQKTETNWKTLIIWTLILSIWFSFAGFLYHEKNFGLFSSFGLGFIGTVASYLVFFLAMKIVSSKFN